MKIAELRRLNAENGGRFFAREHGSRYSRRAWIDADGVAWIWYTFVTFDGGATYRAASFGADGRVLRSGGSQNFASSAEAEAWIKARVSV